MKYVSSGSWLSFGSTFPKVFAIAATIVVSGFFVQTARADSAVLGVTQISAVQTFATADNTFTNGWKWVFNVTVPDNETVLTMKFADWTNGSNSIPAGSNIRFYSAQSSNASDADHSITLGGAGVYSNTANLIPGTDLDISRAGRQIQVTVEARVPVDSSGGSYSTSYGVNSIAPDTTALGNSISISQTAHDIAIEGIVPGNHTAGAKAALQSAIDVATIAMNTTPTTQDSINAAKSTLDTAFATFNTTVVGSSDLSILSTAITLAQNISAGATVGVAPGQYAQSSVDTLNMAITVAQGITNAESQLVVDDAVITLNTAVSDFNATVVGLSDISLLTVAKATAQGLIDANATESTTPGDHVIGSLALLASAHAAADATNATAQLVIDAQVVTLNDAITAYNNAVVASSNMTAYNTALGAVTESNFTTASWSTYQVVVLANVRTNQDTQAAVDTSTGLITAAQADLVAVANLTAYDAALAAVVESNFTTATWTTYQGVVAANVVTAQNTQAQVDTATAAITSAQADLVLNP